MLQNEVRANEFVKIFSDDYQADELLLSWMEVYDNHYEIVFGDYREDVIKSIVIIKEMKIVILLLIVFTIIFT